MHPSEERRTTPRYSPVVENARVGWWEGGQFRSEPARLDDIGHGGAALRLDEDVLCTPSVWMCVVGNFPTEWVPASLLPSFGAAAEGNSRRLRLQFPNGCPYEVFKQVWGNAAPGSTEPLARAQPAPDTLPAMALDLLPGAEPRSVPAIDSREILESFRINTSGALPTLPSAERSILDQKARIAFLPYAMIFILSATSVVLLLILIYERFGELSIIEWLLRGTTRTR
jgi:hypothetical protein